MTGLKICTRHSNEPYYISDQDINIYSMEELAYYLYNYIYFVDRDFFVDALFKYIDVKLDNPNLAYKLRSAVGQNMHYTELVMMIVVDSHYYDEEEIIVLRKTLEDMRTKNSEQRMKARADMLLKNNKFGSALMLYYDILRMGGELSLLSDSDEKKAFYSSVYVGMGKIRARMFNYELALESFKNAYRLLPDRANAKYIINSVLMMKKSDMEKNRILCEVEAELSIAKEIERECRDEIRKIEEVITSSEEYHELVKVSEYLANRNLDEYYSDVEKVVNEWEEEYRKSFEVYI